uniref:Putative secreted protein n=1 Tax=Ixodes ricinus TaxID=34613 RepID=A0A6B0UJA9_IXORI
MLTYSPLVMILCGLCLMMQVSHSRFKESVQTILHACSDSRDLQKLGVCNACCPRLFFSSSSFFLAQQLTVTQERHLFHAWCHLNRRKIRCIVWPVRLCACRCLLSRTQIR